MTLIRCPDCDKEVSDQARSCPNCGHPIAKQRPQRVRTAEDSALTRNRGLGDIIIFAPIVIIILVIVFALLGG